jgi:hypothetical protein
MRQEIVKSLQRKKGSNKKEKESRDVPTDDDENREICVRVLLDGTE